MHQFRICQWGQETQGWLDLEKRCETYVYGGGGCLHLLLHPLPSWYSRPSFQPLQMGIDFHLQPSNIVFCSVPLSGSQDALLLLLVLNSLLNGGVLVPVSVGNSWAQKQPAFLWTHSSTSPTPRIKRTIELHQVCTVRTLAFKSNHTSHYSNSFSARNV